MNVCCSSALLVIRAMCCCNLRLSTSHVTTFLTGAVVIALSSPAAHEARSSAVNKASHLKVEKAHTQPHL